MNVEISQLIIISMTVQRLIIFCETHTMHAYMYYQKKIITVNGQIWVKATFIMSTKYLAS